MFQLTNSNHCSGSRSTHTKGASAGHFEWKPVDELLVIVSHSRSRWDREGETSSNYSIIKRFFISSDAFRLIKARAVGATWAGPDFHSF